MNRDPSFISPFAISVYVVHHDKYLLIHRCSPHLYGTWQMVTGKIDEGEKAWETALREIKEETGLIPDRFYSADIVETFYMQALDKIAFVPTFVAFVDNPGEIILAPDEHDDYAWLDYDEAKERLAWWEQKRTLTHVHENLILKKPSDILSIEMPIHGY